MSADRDLEELASELQRVTTAVAERAGAEETLPPRLTTALTHLDRRGSLTTAELAALQDVRHQSMSATVVDLELKGYVDRRGHPSDVRKVLIELTDEGREALGEQRRRQAGWLRRAITERIAPAERRALSDGVAVLARLLD